MSKVYNVQYVYSVQNIKCVQCSNYVQYVLNCTTYIICTKCVEGVLHCASRTRIYFTPTHGTPTLAFKEGQIQIIPTEINSVIPRQFLQRLNPTFCEEGQPIEAPIQSPYQHWDIYKVCIIAPADMDIRDQKCGLKLSKQSRT